MTTDVAWAAGLFEGEGYMIVRAGRPNGPRVYMELGIEMTDEAVLRRFAAVLQAAEVGQRAQVTTRWRGNPKHARQWAWKLTGTEAVRAFLLMRPQLGARRRERGDAIIAARDAWLAEKAEPRICDVCGESFVPRFRQRAPRFCSERCRGRWRLSTPEHKKASNERNRRYKARKRAAARGEAPPAWAAKR